MTDKEKLLNQYSDWLLMRNYSTSTYKAYLGTVRNFWKYCDAKKGSETFEKENAVQSYLAYRKKEGMDFSTINGDYSALQWFYKYILNRDWNVRKLIRPRREKRLPKYLTPQQVNKLLESIKFKKHKVMVLVMYSTGMRLSEMRNLKWEHIIFEDGVVHIEKGKGSKDRMVILHDEMAEILKEYRKEQPELQEYLFEGKTPGKPIAPKTVQWVFKLSRERAGLPDWVTSHSMRHSYATSLLKNGTDLLTLKELLGHKKFGTTSKYLHLTKKFLKRSHNPLSNECLNATVNQTRQNTRSER